MRQSTYIAGALALAALAGSASPGHSQEREARARADRERAVRAWSIGTNADPDRMMLGIGTSSGGERDTLGLLVTSITPGGPAEKAGLEEGNRIAAVNGVNLRLAAADAGEPDMDGILTRRLTRELSKVKEGDEVELRVWANGAFKTVRARPVKAEDMPGRSVSRRVTRDELESRPTLGMSVGTTGSRRDTLGIMIMRVAPDGPAEKAGIIEGDRVAAINGVDVRVAREDAGDSYSASAKMNRFRRELGKIELGSDVELRVVSGGQSRTVRVRPARMGDVVKDGSMMFFGDGPVFDMVMPALPATPAVPVAPGRVRVMPAPRAPRVWQFDADGDVSVHMSPRAADEIRRGVREALEQARELRDVYLGDEALQSARESLEAALRGLRGGVRVWTDDDIDAETAVAPKATPAPKARVVTTVRM